jgi:hypothetical protein
MTLLDALKKEGLATRYLSWQARIMPLPHNWMGRASSISDCLDGPPEGDRLTQWIGGVVFPAIVGVFSVGSLVRQNYGFGVFVCLLAAFLHFHFFWGLTERYGFVSFIGKNLTALGMILCCVYGLYVAICCQ